MKEVQSVTLVLENCEFLTFDQKDIGHFWCDEITSTIARIACNAITRLDYCKEFFIQLRNTANQTYDSFGGPSEHTTFERLHTFDDVTSVEVTYDDGSVDSCNVPWNEGNEYSNKFQTSFISDGGHLYLLISGTKTVEELLKLQESARLCEDYDSYWPFID